MTKKEVRELVRSRRASFSDAAIETERIWERIESLEAFRSAHNILIYMALPDEVPTDGFISRWQGSKTFVIPLVCGDSLELYRYDPALLREGYKGILEPAYGAVRVHPSQIDFALVPGVAFERKEGRLCRLGRGKGYYDRLLPLLGCPKAGVFFSCSLVEDLPLDPWDCSLDY